MSYMILPLKRFFDFSGRSRRKEYWMFVVFQIIVYAVVVGLVAALGAGASDAGSSDAGAAVMAGLGLAVLLPLLLLIVPNLAVQVRRLHDQDKSGWMLLLGFIPLIGGFIMIYFMCVGGTRGPNQYGPDPKNALDVGDTFA